MSNAPRSLLSALENPWKSSDGDHVAVRGLSQLAGCYSVASVPITSRISNSSNFSQPCQQSPGPLGPPASPEIRAHAAMFLYRVALGVCVPGHLQDRCHRRSCHRLLNYWSSSKCRASMCPPLDCVGHEFSGNPRP